MKFLPNKQKRKKKKCPLVEQQYAFCHALYGIKGFMEFVECSFTDGYFSLCLVHSWASQVVLVIKIPPANADRHRRPWVDPWVGQIP